MLVWSVPTHNDLYCVLNSDLSSVQQGHSVLLNCYLLIVLVTVKSINTVTKVQKTFKAARADCPRVQDKCSFLHKAQNQARHFLTATSLMYFLLSQT